MHRKGREHDRPHQRRPVADLGDELMKIITEVQSANPDRAIEHTIAIEGPIHCDPHRVTQLFSNLLGNAATHGAPHKPVRVEAHGAAGALTLVVRNEGEPISPETMAQLFKPYARPTQDAPRAGLGLGLYIAAEIARSHAGTISISSTQAHGTAFTFKRDGPK
jgi:signal transduction histidine kinase